MNMTSKRNQASFDLVMPVPVNHRSDSQTRNHVDTIWTNIDSRAATIVNSTLVSEPTDMNNHHPTKKHSSARPKVEILRANSPTLKRLLAVRIKLDRYVALMMPPPISINRPTDEFVPEIPPNVPVEKPISAVPARSARPKTQKSAAKSRPSQGPVDKITYEKTTTRNGNVKQKCSLEIWLPKPDQDEEEENGNLSRAGSPKSNSMANKNQSPTLGGNRSRRSSTTKVIPGPLQNTERKSLDDIFEKQPDATDIPRVYRFEKSSNDQSEERPRSGKSGDTLKSVESTNTLRRRRLHRQKHSSPSGGGNNNHSDDGSPTAIPIPPMSSKNLLENIRQNSSGQETKGNGETNQSMINELMRKYSIMKKSHQELTQTKLQLERPHQESKGSAHHTKDTVPLPLSSLPPPSVPSETTSNPSVEHPSISVKKLTLDTSPPRSAVDHSHMNTKLLERRSSHRKVTHTEALPQTRLVTLANHIQYRQSSANMPPPPLLPAVVGKRTDEAYSFHRSKTMDIDLDTTSDSLNSSKVSSTFPAQPDNRDVSPTSVHRLQRFNKGNEQLFPTSPKRLLPAPLLAFRTDQQRQAAQPILHLVQYHNVQTSAQRYHHVTHAPHVTSAGPTNTTTSTATTAQTASNNKVLVHLKYSNGGHGDQPCLIPE